MKNCRYTRIARLVVPALLSVLLVACGNGAPSESDARQAVKTELGDCKYVSMSDFDKMNGQQSDDANHYEVQIKYRLTLEADGDQKDQLKTHLDRLNQRNDLIKQEERIRVDFMNQGNGSDAYNDPTWKDLDQKQKALYQQLATTYGPAAFAQAFHQTCPDFPASTFDQLMAKTDGLTFNGKNALDFSGALSMVKTDNGWQAAR